MSLKKFIVAVIISSHLSEPEVHMGILKNFSDDKIQFEERIQDTVNKYLFDGEDKSIFPYVINNGTL